MSHTEGALGLDELARMVGEPPLAGAPDPRAFDVQPWTPPNALRRDLGLPESLWVVSDRRPTSGPLAPEHVMGVGGASESLATITPREPVAAALDLGCGSGVQALLLGYHADRVVASDISPRALWCTALTCALNDRPVPELVLADLAGPFAPDEFDLVVSDPPFVMAPEARHVYRDSPAPADTLTARLLADIARILRPGGTVVLLTSWLVPDDGDWATRVLGWADAGRWQRLWAALREQVTPEQYVDLWLLDSGQGRDAELRLRWEHHLGAMGAAAIGFGWVLGVTSAGAADEPSGGIWAEDVRSARVLPTGAQVRAEVDRRQGLPGAADLLGRGLRLADDALLTAVDVGGHAAAADALLLSVASSWRGPQPLDPALSWLFARVTADRDARVGRTITLAELLPACADDTGWEAADVLVSWLSGVRDLLGAGFAALDGGPGPARQ